jgi:putative phage-type endonuclease
MPSFHEKVKDWITLLENWLSYPEDYVQLEQWIASAEELAHSYEFTDQEEELIDMILDSYEEQFNKRLQLHKENIESNPNCPTIDKLNELLERKQTEQRTEEWYRQMSEIISASELGQLFAAPRQRAKLVISKTLPYQPRNQPLAVYSDQMTAFDWGIRFEPVVKQIYEEKYKVVIKELGRLHHPEQPKCTASPDGLIYHCPKGIRTGRLIEIKCPVSREIDGSIPKDYYTQMQMQLHVTGLKTCDYVEAEFASPYQQQIPKHGPSYYSGMIALVFIRNQQSTDSPGRFDYRYSPVNSSTEWEPMLESNEEVVEWIPWRLMKWCEQTVARNDEWWISLQATLKTFWDDVERAKRGEFTIPESTRPSKKAKTMPSPTLQSMPCMIQFHKLDENGHPYTETLDGL